MTKIDQEILIYQSLPYKKHRWIGYASVFHMGFLALNALVLPTPRLIRERTEALHNRVKKKQQPKIIDDEASTLNNSEYIEEYEPNPEYDPATVWQRLRRLAWREIFNPNNIKENFLERPAVSIGFLGVSALVCSAYLLYARRSIHKIFLLPNGRARLNFFSPFAIGKPPSLDIPLDNISCVTNRKSKVNYAILKIKGYWGYHLVHKVDGDFLEPKLYDQYLGFERSWAARK